MSRNEQYDPMTDHAGERPEANPLADDMIDDAGSGMGKEVKIGLTVVLLLLGTLGYVAYDRFLGSADEARETAENEAGDSSGLDSQTAQSPDNPFPTGAVPPTIVEPTTPPSDGLDSLLANLGPPSDPSNLFATTVSETPQEPGSSPPSYMAPPASAEPTGRYAVNVTEEASTGSSWDAAGIPPYTPAAPPEMPETSPEIPSYDTAPTTMQYGNPNAISPSPTQSSSTSWQALGSPPVENMNTAVTITEPPTISIGNSGSQVTSVDVQPMAPSAYEPPAPYEPLTPVNPVTPNDYAAVAGQDIRPIGQSSPEQYSSPTPVTAAPSTQDTAEYEGRSFGQNSYLSNPPQSPREVPSYTAETPMAPLYDNSPRNDVASAAATEPATPISQVSAVHESYPVQPAAIQDGEYTAQPMDNFFTISEKVYGTGKMYQALAEHNRARHPDSDVLQVGDKISVPTIKQLEELYPNHSPTREHRETAQLRQESAYRGVSHNVVGGNGYVVQEGDNLFQIAKFELGKVSRWVEIYNLNRQQLGADFNYLTPGMTLAMPPGEQVDTVAGRPNATYQR